MVVLCSLNTGSLRVQQSALRSRPATRTQVNQAALQATLLLYLRTSPLGKCLFGQPCLGCHSRTGRQAEAN